jgi:hypothetical protein
MRDQSLEYFRRVCTVCTRCRETSLRDQTELIGHEAISFKYSECVSVFWVCVCILGVCVYSECVSVF